MLKNLIAGVNTASLSKEEIAEILKTDPKALSEFENTYQKYAITDESEDFFQINSRQAAKKRKDVNDTGLDILDISDIINRAVAELISETSVYVYDGEKDYVIESKTYTSEYLTNENICSLPEKLRPNLTGKLMQKDINGQTSDVLLWHLKKIEEEKNPAQRKYHYDHFRQGLDILDLDALTYEIIGTNNNSMGKWFPQIVQACAEQSFFRIPKTRIAKVPLPMLQLTRLEYQALSKTTMEIVNKWAQEVFALNPDEEYFIKTGTYSSKFDFRNAHAKGASEVKEIGEYLLFIHFQALQMASPLCNPCIYGASTTNEWVVREFIQDKENNPSIYKGLPLHTEYRIFVDCDTDKVIGYYPYWEAKTMKKRFLGGASDSMHDAHDYLIYQAHEETLMKRYSENIETIVEHIAQILPELNLAGQWSLDVMQNEEEFWIIDMAVAENSAFYQCVPRQLRRPMSENWIPVLPQSK